MKIVADANIPYVKDYFGSYGELILIPGREMTHANVKTADILLVRSITPVNKRLVANTSVKFVGSVTAGKDHLDTDFFEEAGILWCTADGFNAPPVADYVVSVIAALQKRHILQHSQNKAAVIGVGQVGRMVAKRLTALGMHIIYCDPIRAVNEKDFISVDIEEIKDVDLITLHVPLTHVGHYATRQFINQSVLKRQRLGCILLNASRGAVIHTKDLLQYGQHLYWCLDVFEQEPNVDKYILQRSTITTPHIAGYSVQSKMRGIDMVYREICARKMIMPATISPLAMPRQKLFFSGENYHWQDIVLGIFNPLLMTTMMRTLMLSASNTAELFDNLRNQFNYRHEFSFTVVQANVLEADKEILAKLGISTNYT
jgi:erythronate-4-phosphate dehydrogenase